MNGHVKPKVWKTNYTELARLMGSFENHWVMGVGNDLFAYDTWELAIEAALCVVDKQRAFRTELEDILNRVGRFDV